MSGRAREQMQNVPALRFRVGEMSPAETTETVGNEAHGNTGRARTLVVPWKRERLGAIGFPYNGLSGKSKSDFGHGLGRYVTYMNIFSHPIADPVQCDAIEIDKGQNEVKDGDVFFTTSSETPEEVGMSSVWMGDGTNTYLNSFCFGYRPKPGNVSEFLAYLFRANGFRSAISFLAQGISRYNISKTKVMDIEIPLPDVIEQQKIGSFFRSLDTLVDGREKALGKLESLKKAMLEKMFPQGDAKTPQVRFKGFEGEWTEKKLGAVLSYEQPQPYIVSSTEYKDSGIPVLTVGKTFVLGYTNEVDGIYPASKKPTILFDDFLAISRYVDFDFKVKSSAVKMLNIKNGVECDLLCVSYLLEAGESVAEEHARHWINVTSQKSVRLPSLLEQQIIGAYFRSLDALLAARREEVVKLKQLKQAFLERMFV